MKTAVETGLPDLNMPLEWAVLGEGKTLYITVCAVYLDGSIEIEDPQKQFDLTIENMKRTVEAAGGSLDDITLC